MQPRQNGGDSAARIVDVPRRLSETGFMRFLNLAL